MWKRIKQFFSYSETIFLARLEVILGFLLAALSSVDWSPLFAAGSSPNFNWKTGLTLGIILIIRGLILEWARRRRDNDL